MYSKQQIKEISKNKNVVKCSSKSITFKNKFKLWCVNKYYNKQYSPTMIFKEAGLYNLVSRITIDNGLRRWKKIFKEKGESGFLKETRGLSRRTKNKEEKNKSENDKKLKSNKEEYIKYLETENAYLKELNKIINHGDSP